ncbi:helix-turn-helix domain-containing protein [Butyrivibrio sp. MC2013]|uniref:helix-turn-helix domain-containing protein n=1 Tax=Butyrivibrio sp. MC2013 TaxID=1280686 RepID=UPI00047EA886
MQNIPAINMAGTGQRISDLRRAAGLSVKDLQDIFGFATPQAIYKWQHGTAMPTLDNLVVLSVVLGVAIDDILVLDSASIISFSA